MTRSDKDRAVDDLAMLEAVAAPILLLDSADKITFANAACRAHHPELAQISADGGETLGAVADLAIHRQALADGMTLVTLDASDATALAASQSHAHFATLHDAVTGLGNRTALIARLREKLLDADTDEAGHFAVVHIDIDRFRMINESLGVIKGDDVIAAVGTRLAEGLTEGDTLSRFGGDEFVAIIDNVPTPDLAAARATALLASLDAPFRVDQQEIFISASAGIAHTTLSGPRVEDFIRDAELAMYGAKEDGRARTCVFQRDMRRARLSPLDMETDLRRALARNQMELYYQPIISLETHRLRGFEALLRWHREGHGVVSPQDFIPIAEEIGLISELGDWVLAAACGQMQAWNAARAPDQMLEMSVNLSSRQFSELDLVERIVARLDGLHAPALKLEITESVLMDNAARTTDMLQRLKNHNIRVCIDDFGTGYSSLSYLHTFPIDTLKIDKSFVQDMTRNRQNLEIIRTIMLLARNLRLDITAEGVETAEQLTQLQALGCNSVQGFMFAPPLTATAAQALIVENREW